MQHVRLFYYDVNAEDIEKYFNRLRTPEQTGKVRAEFTAGDSLMYINIKQQMLLHPTWKTITLSGNIHNMLLPFNGKIKMGLYLHSDPDLRLKDSLLSIVHRYRFGTTLNDIGNFFLYPSSAARR